VELLNPKPDDPVPLGLLVLLEPLFEKPNEELPLFVDPPEVPWAPFAEPPVPDAS
jgi:hypothetical protein